MPNYKSQKKDNTLPLAGLGAIFGGDYTLQEIADVIGVTRERVRQIEVTALKKLRHPKFIKQWREINETIQMMESSRAQGRINN